VTDTIPAMKKLKILAMRDMGKPPLFQVSIQLNRLLIRIAGERNRVTRQSSKVFQFPL